LLVSNSWLLLLSTGWSLHKEGILLLVELSLVGIQEIGTDISIVGCLLENVVVCVASIAQAACIKTKTLVK